MINACIVALRNFTTEVSVPKYFVAHNFVPQGYCSLALVLVAQCLDTV